MLLAFLSFVGAVVLLNVLIPKAMPHRTPISRVLYLREITAPVNAMITEKKPANVFTAEFVVLFEYICNAVDYAVMKYVGDDVKILSKQENKHAVMHINAMKHRKSEGEYASRWQWLLKLSDFLLLRCGKAVGTPLVTMFEASTWGFFYVLTVFPFINRDLPNLFVFHAFEEIEHGALTVQSLKRRTNPVFLVLGSVLVFIVYFIALLCPPIIALAMNPALLLNPATYLDLLQYYVGFGVSFVATTVGQVVYGLLPFHENQAMYQYMFNSLEKELKERNVAWNVVDQATYTIE